MKWVLRIAGILLVLWSVVSLARAWAAFYEADRYASGDFQRELERAALGHRGAEESSLDERYMIRHVQEDEVRECSERGYGWLLSWAAALPAGAALLVLPKGTCMARGILCALCLGSCGISLPDSYINVVLALGILVVVNLSLAVFTGWLFLRTLSRGWRAVPPRKYAAQRMVFAVLLSICALMLFTTGPGPVAGLLVVASVPAWMLAMAARQPIAAAAAAVSERPAQA